MNSMKKELEEVRAGFTEAIQRNLELLIINLCRYYSEVETPNSKALLRISNAIDFLIRLRIEKATEFMAATPDINVTETSLKTGFENSAYFSKKFKEIVGITPMAYLKKQRELTEI